MIVLMGETRCRIMRLYICAAPISMQRIICLNVLSPPLDLELTLRLQNSTSLRVRWVNESCTAMVLGFPRMATLKTRPKRPTHEVALNP